MDGIIVVNKPKGITSRDVVNKVCKLLNTKKINQISIKELTQTSNVARSTFYAYYDNIDNLLEEIENTFIEKLNTLDQSIRDPATNNFTYFYEVLSYVKK